MSKVIYLFILIFANTSWGQDIGINNPKAVQAISNSFMRTVAAKDAEIKKEEALVNPAVFSENSFLIKSPVLEIKNSEKQEITFCPKDNPPPSCGSEVVLSITDQQSKLTEKIKNLDSAIKDTVGAASKEIQNELVEKVLPTDADYKKLSISITKSVSENKSNESKDKLIEGSIHDINSNNDNVSEIRKEFDGRFFGVGKGMSDSITDLVKHRNSLVKSSFLCISNLETAKTTCNKSTSVNGKKAAKVMSELSAFTESASASSGGGSASTILQYSGQAFSLTRELILRAEIQCGKDLSAAELMCATAMSMTDKINEELVKISISSQNIIAASGKHILKLNLDIPKCGGDSVCISTNYNKILAYTRIGELASMITTKKIEDFQKTINSIKESTLIGDFSIKSNIEKISLLSKGPYVEHSQMQSMLTQNAMQSFASLKQISGNSGDGDKADATKSTMSINEMCAQPLNAQTSTCKCRLNNSAIGCPGYIANMANNNTLTKTTSTAGPSNLASINYKASGTPPGTTTANPKLGELGKEAQNALAAISVKDFNNAGDTKGSSDSEFKASDGASSSAGGSGGLSDSNGSTANKAKDGEKEESKFIGSTFSNAVGSFFKGDFFGGGRRPSNAKQKSTSRDEYKVNIQRSIANQQARSEVSNASGISNWEKVKQRYKNQNDSLIGN